jgi:hypothetical protein
MQSKFRGPGSVSGAGTFGRLHQALGKAGISLVSIETQEQTACKRAAATQRIHQLPNGTKT